MRKRITEKQTSALGEIRKILAEANDDRFVYLRYNDSANETIVSAPENLTVPPDIEGVFLGGLRRSAESLSDRSKPGPQGTAVATPAVLPGKQPRASIVLTAPVVAGGGFRGVLSAVVDFQPFWDDMLRRRRTGHAVFILDEKGRLFAARGGSGMPLPEEFLHSDLVKRFLSSRGSTRETMPFALKRGPSTERYMGSYELTRSKWGVFVQAKQAQVYRPLSDMRTSALQWSLLALALATAAAVVFAGRLSHPIERLAAASRALMAGEFTARVDG